MNRCTIRLKRIKRTPQASVPVQYVFILIYNSSDYEKLPEKFKESPLIQDKSVIDSTNDVELSFFLKLDVISFLEESNTKIMDNRLPSLEHFIYLLVTALEDGNNKRILSISCDILLNLTISTSEQYEYMYLDPFYHFGADLYYPEFFRWWNNRSYLLNKENIDKEQWKIDDSKISVKEKIEIIKEFINGFCNNITSN